MEEKLKFPTEQIELPSKGLPYPAESLLSKGVLEMKYMSAKEEDILTNVNFLKNGTVIDKLLQSMIVTSIDYDDLLICDKNALLVAARILGYGKDYEFEYDGQKINFDLSSVDPLPLNENIKPGRNEFDFHLWFSLPQYRCFRQHLLVKMLILLLLVNFSMLRLFLQSLLPHRSLLVLSQCCILCHRC
jgi:hypothetical protein